MNEKKKNVKLSNATESRLKGSAKNCGGANRQVAGSYPPPSLSVCHCHTSCCLQLRHCPHCVRSRHQLTFMMRSAFSFLATDVGGNKHPPRRHPLIIVLLRFLGDRNTSAKVGKARIRFGPAYSLTGLHTHTNTHFFICKIIQGTLDDCMKTCWVHSSC